MNSSPITAWLDHEALWLGVVFLPLLAACAFLVRPWRPFLSRCIPLAALPALLFAVLVPPGSETNISWLILGTRLGMDVTGKVFLFFTAVVWLIAGVYAISYLRDPEERSRFFPYYLFAMTGNFGLILAQDVASFYAFFSLMSFAAYGLVVHSGTTDARYAGKVYIVLVVMGEALIFLGLLLAAGAAHSIYVANVPAALAASPHRGVIVGLLLLGFGIKAGALPVHVWLPLAHPAAPIPASAVLSGAMIKAGLLGWLRFLPLGEVAMPRAGDMMMGLGLAAAFYGVLVGLTQTRPKTVLAYSSISQMGLITLAVGTTLAAPSMWPYAWSAILITATHHALAKGALFLSVGLATERAGRVWGHRLQTIGVVFPALVLAGLPFTGGAVAKLALKYATQAAPGAWPAAFRTLLPLAAVGTTLIMARFLWLVWPRRTAKEQTAARGVLLPWAFSVICVAFAPLLLRSELFAAVQVPAMTAGVLWSGLWPLLLGGLLAGLALKFSLRNHGHIPEGDLLFVYLGAIRWMQALTPKSLKVLLAREQSAALTFWKPRAVVKRVGVYLGTGENRLALWTSFGATFLTLMTFLFLSLVST